MAYTVKLSTRRPCVAASTSASADAEDLTTSSGDCSNANFAPKYNSQELDKESDLYYFNARHYDPELARFVTADVMVDGERRDDKTGLIISSPTYGWNRYMYVAGNPIMYKDPTGHLVDGVFDKDTGTLYLVDIDTGEELTVKAESGNSLFGDSIGKGDYEILERKLTDDEVKKGKDQLFRLERLDTKYGDDKNQETDQTNLRLHEPGNTTGCIACKDKEGWEKTKKLLNNTETTETQVESKSIIDRIKKTLRR